LPFYLLGGTLADEAFG
jgi:hypothetical protein